MKKYQLSEQKKVTKSELIECLYQELEGILFDGDNKGEISYDVRDHELYTDISGVAFLANDHVEQLQEMPNDQRVCVLANAINILAYGHVRAVTDY